MFVLLLAFAAFARAQDTQPFKTVDKPTPAYAHNVEVLAETRRLLSAHDTAGLEALAAGLRKSGESSDSGRWMLSTFYDGAVAVPRGDAAREKAAMDFYEGWAQQRPQSITAQVCLAMALTDYAWNARGSGWASTVTKEGWRLFGERLERARDVLTAAKKLEEKCPGWFEAAQTVALGQGWSRNDYMAMMDEAIRLTPTYGQYYTNTCYWLLPRWNGERGDFEAWVAKQADTYPPDKREQQYARFVWDADRLRMSDEMVFGARRLDWDRTRRGFELWIGADPDNLVVLTEYARLATLAGDRDTAARLFKRIDGRFVPGMWNDDPNLFRAARKFALEHGGNPMTHAAHSARSPMLSGDQAQTANLVSKLASGFLGGLLAGLLLFFLAMQRGRTGAGVVTLLACMALGTAFGTMASMLPAAGLWFWLRRKVRAVPPEIAPSRGWVVLIWVLVLAGLYGGLQILATIPITVVYVLEHGLRESGEVVRWLLASGISLIIVINAAWLTFLTLLLVCRPQPAAGWRQRLGLNPCWNAPTLAWTLAVVLLLLGIGVAMDGFLDARTRSTVEMIAAGTHSPMLFVVALALVAPLLEELIFRGYALSGWLPWLGMWGAGALSAVLFTACHFQYGWVGLLMVFILGASLAFLRWKSGSVYPCIAVHGVYNLAFAIGCFFTAH